MNPPDPDLAQAADDFRKGGWVIALLGVAGALIRLLLSEREHHWVVWVKHAIAGGLTGIVVYFALHGANIDPLYKSVILSSCGAMTPRLFELLDAKIRRIIKSLK